MQPKAESSKRSVIQFGTSTKVLFSLLILVPLAGCSSPRKPSASATSSYPDRDLTAWQPGRAIEEADRDVAAGHPKIYLCGTIAAFAPGVETADLALIESLQKAEAGVGCVILDAPLRSAQFAYARSYNARVVQHLKGTADPR